MSGRRRFCDRSVSRSLDTCACHVIAYGKLGLIFTDTSGPVHCGVPNFSADGIEED